MNRILLSLALFLAAWTACAQNAKAVYMKYSDMKGVEAAYISREMFETFGRLPKIEILDEDLDLTPVVRELKSLYVLESDNPRISARIREDVSALVRQGGYTLIMRDRDDDEETEIYAIINGDRVSSLLFLSCEGRHELDFICLEGDILKEDLNRILRHSDKPSKNKIQ